MKDLLNWIIAHWAELTAALGTGGAGALGAKKLADRKQDDKINELQKKINALEKEMAQLKNDISTNTMFDKQFREQVEKDYKGIKNEMGEIKDRLNQILEHLLNKSVK